MRDMISPLRWVRLLPCAPIYSLARLVQPGESDDIGSQNGGKAALGAFFSHAMC
jgi:hypothetical protein